MPKVTLSKAYLFAGKHYGPGEVDISDADAAAALTERERAVAGQPDAAPAHALNTAQNPADGQANPDAETQTRATAPSVPRRERAKNGGEA